MVDGMANPLDDGVMLCKSWLDNPEVWAHRAAPLLKRDPVAILGQLSHIAGQLAKAVAAEAGGDWTPAMVLDHLLVTP